MVAIVGLCVVFCLIGAIVLRRRPVAPGSQSGPLRVIFLHPDLGIGGAERLVVDACCAAQDKGHRVVAYTSHHDPVRCFAETRDGTLTVRVAGDSLPRSMCGRLHIVCAIARSLVLTAHVLSRELLCEPRRADVAFVDQLSAPVPFLWLFGIRVVFYCHFPDKLLATREGRPSLLKTVYRLPFDVAEELTTGFATTILVNSHFTQGVYARAFPLLRTLRKPPAVLWPGISRALADQRALPPPPAGVRPLVLLSLNRYERKKGVELAVRGLSLMDRREDARLVIAGGYDDRLAENRDYMQELRDLATTLGVAERVRFLCSVSDADREQLFEEAAAVLYTPRDEHFGIVPIEAMSRGRPVIAVNSGGPLETIAHLETGILCPPTPEAFAGAMDRLVADDEQRMRMGDAGRRRVLSHFSPEAFATRLDQILRRTATAL